MEMETLTDAITRLRDSGYASDFAALADGALLCGACGSAFDPGSLVVERVVRFEGSSDPGDAAILLALRCSCGRAGLFSSAYGADVAPEDALALTRLTAAG
ncbi:MAG: hypothetical protein ACT452_18340 [Microthrixaceae bacterium]